MVRQGTDGGFRWTARGAKQQQRRACIPVPQVDRAVVAAASQLSIIRMKRDGPHRQTSSAKSEWLLLRPFNFVKPHVSILAAGRQEGAIAREGQREDRPARVGQEQRCFRP